MKRTRMWTTIHPRVTREHPDTVWLMSVTEPPVQYAVITHDSKDPMFFVGMATVREMVNETPLKSNDLMELMHELFVLTIGTTGKEV